MKMIKLSVSQAARQLGISRTQLQNQINMGKLQTHEGYVTTQSIRCAYPDHRLDSEQDKHLEKMQVIKANALHKIGVVKHIQQENERILSERIAKFQIELTQEKLKNSHFQLVFSELKVRLNVLEKCCSKQDKKALHQLQNWVQLQH
jgi:hypothetical protein